MGSSDDEDEPQEEATVPEQGPLYLESSSL